MQEIGILENLQKSLALKEGMLSYEMMGKSLSYNPAEPELKEHNKIIQECKK